MTPRKKRMIAGIVTAFYLAGIIFAVEAAMKTRTAQGAVAWSVSLVSFPFVAVPAYLVFGRSKFEGMSEAFESRRDDFERLLTDWSGPGGRLGRMRFRMKASVYAGERVRLGGEVTGREVDGQGCSWVRLRLTLHSGDRLATECEARFALPADETGNPWQRRGEDWQP